MNKVQETSGPGGLTWRRHPSLEEARQLQIPDPLPSDPLWPDLTWATFGTAVLEHSRTLSHRMLLSHLLEEARRAWPAMCSPERMTELLSLSVFAMLPSAMPTTVPRSQGELYRRRVMA